ncbi:MAG: sugar phosphate isomerase/epimerase family protein [Akkermansiaceae bacterium]
MKRRSLFTMIPAASVLLALRSKGAPIPQAALTEAGFGLTVQCWSLKEFTLFQAIEMAAAAGVGGVEVFSGHALGGGHDNVKFGPGMPEDKLQAVIDHIKANNITAQSMGVIPIPNNEAEARAIFELGKKLGLYSINTESIDSIELIETLAKEYDIKVGFHNHPKKPNYKMWDPDFVFSAVKDRHANVGICADTGHWATSGLNPLEVIKKIAPRVVSFHMKDRESIEKWTHDRPFGTGVIDNIAILDEVRKHGFKGNVTIEYEHNWKSNLPEIAQCVGYLRAYAKVRA